MIRSLFAALVLISAAIAPAHSADLTALLSPAEVAKYQGDGGKLRMTDNPAGTNAFARFAMQKYKLDKKYGFEMQIVPVGTSQAALTALQAEGADVIVADFMFLSRAKHAGVKAIGIGPILKWADHVVVPANSPIKSLCDLRGKKVGTVLRSASYWLVVRAAALKQCGLDLEKDASIQEGGVALLRGLMEQGQLDATFIFNNVTPAMTVTGKFRVLAQLSELIGQIGLPPDAPFLLFAAQTDYAAAHPKNVKAFMAAYREAVQILAVDDDAWVEQGRIMKMDEASIPLVREEMRADLLSKFDPTTEAGIRKTFDILLATAGPEVLGMSKLPDVFMTLEYQ
jgi:NitT/TauT family transport system substrate-binding protein